MSDQLDLNDLKFKSIKIGNDGTEIPGENVFEVHPPSRGLPFWRIHHADDYDEKEQIMIVANKAIVIDAEKKPPEPVEEVVQIDE